MKRNSPRAISRSGARRPEGGRVGRGLGGLVLLLGLGVVGCSLVRQETAQTGAMIRSLGGKGEETPPPSPVTELQARVMREADQYVATLERAADDFSARTTTADFRTAALQWKLQQATAAYVNATGENPALNAVDQVVLATLSRLVIEDDWLGRRFGEAARPLLEAHRQLETNALALVRTVLTPAQEQEVRSLVREWRAQNPFQREVAAVRFNELVGRLGQSAAEARKSQSGSVFNLAFIDPLAGLDPAVRSIEQTRFLAARAMYYAQRAPKLLSWQVELLTMHLANQPAARQVLADATRFATSTEAFAQATGQLPQLVREEREAAIRQLLAGVATERSNILAGLESQEAKLRELLPEMRQTLTAGGAMAESLGDAVKSLEAFVRYVSPPASPAATRPAGSNAAPFQVLDYGTAATQVGAAARELNALLATLNQSLPQIRRLTEQASADADRVVDRAFRRGLVLIAVLLAGSVLAGLAYRVLADRLKRAGISPSVSKP